MEYTIVHETAYYYADGDPRELYGRPLAADERRAPVLHAVRSLDLAASPRPQLYRPVRQQRAALRDPPSASGALDPGALDRHDAARLGADAPGRGHANPARAATRTSRASTIFSTRASSSSSIRRSTHSMPRSAKCRQEIGEWCFGRLPRDPERLPLRYRGDERPDEGRGGARAPLRRLPGFRARDDRRVAACRDPGALRERLHLLRR